ncbi:MAG: stage II sporulation protein M [Candidatus Brocadiia bacterium]
MDLNDFLRQRRARWQRLAALLDRVDRRGLGDLSASEADDFFALYRLVSSDLNLVQTRTANPALLEYLEQLVGRAYANLAVPRRANPLKAWWRIVRHRFPAVMRAERRLLGVAALALLAGALFGFFATWASPRTVEVFLPPEHLARSPRERVEGLEAMEREGETRLDTVGKQAHFSTFLFTHNIRVTVFGFALGLTFGVGTVLILFYNGALLGSITAYYLADGVLTFFVAWVGPHGAIELPCVVFGCTAGLMLARAQFCRERGSLGAQLRALRPALADLLVGTATFLVLAGVIEGSFSQVNEPTVPYALKIAVALALFAALLCYLFVMPVRSRAVVEGAAERQVEASPVARAVPFTAADAS